MSENAQLKTKPTEKSNKKFKTGKKSVEKKKRKIKKTTKKRNERKVFYSNTCYLCTILQHALRNVGEQFVSIEHRQVFETTVLLSSAPFPASQAMPLK